MLNQAVQDLREFCPVGNAESSAFPDQADRFVEFLIFGSENYRYSIHGSFKGIVDTDSETSADISDLPIPVDR